jgi:hypothetical protein
MSDNNLPYLPTKREFIFTFDKSNYVFRSYGQKIIYTVRGLLSSKGQTYPVQKWRTSFSLIQSEIDRLSKYSSLAGVTIKYIDQFHPVEIVHDVIIPKGQIDIVDEVPPGVKRCN